jgi:hypothetical protein
MATVGTKLTIPFTVGASQIVGQGNHPELWVLYSIDDASDTDPLWQDATSKIRAWATSRGRNTELEEIDAGTATITLDNRTRTFDPVANTAIRPMNRWWIREQFSGETQDMFKGYADSYDQQWPAPVGDALAVVSCTDEFKVLALDRLPTTDPPRDNYADMVMFDQPTGYWRMNDDAETLQAASTIGPSLAAPVSGVSQDTDSAIIGDPGSALQTSGTEYLFHTVEAGDTGDVAGLGEFTVETWFMNDSNAYPAATTDIITGPTQGGGQITYQLRHLSSGVLEIAARNSGGSTITATSSSIILQQWHHVVGTITGGSLRLYLNGAQVAANAWTGTFGAVDAGSQFIVGDNGGTSVTIGHDEVAFYRYGLSASRITAHYVAGTQRGFQTQQSGARIGAILDAIDSQASRRLDAGVRTIFPRYMIGQDALGEIRMALRSDDPDSVLFAAKDGTLVYLDNDHRSSSPYNTIQLTFDDDGTDLPYTEIDLDYSEAFLVNDWNVTRTGGLVQTASDATSISRYFKRSQSITDLPVTSDAESLSVANAMLAKYKDPMIRITSLTVTTQLPDLAEAIFRRDIGDRIRILRTPPGGGARIDQTSFIQKIDASGSNDGQPWKFVFSVSPL